MTPKVLVVGAGPTGLTAAVELARQGVVPVLVEKRSEPSGFSRAVGIQPSSMDIFARSGVDAAIRDEAVVFRGVRFHRDAERVAEFPLNFDERSRLWGLAQDRTETHLAEAFRHHGGEIRFRTAFEALEEHADGVDVTFGGHTERFDCVIGADGVQSSVRLAVGISYVGYDLADTWSIADIYAPAWQGGAWFMGYLLPRGNLVVVVPMEKTRFRVISSTPDALSALPVPIDVTKLRRSGSFRISVRQASRYQTRRVFLAGDAAHAHSPVGGRGMNLGIGDAADLAGRIVSGDLEGYHAARHQVGARVVKFSERGRRTLQSKRRVTRGLVVAALRAVGAVPALGRAAVRILVNG